MSVVHGTANPAFVAVAHVDELNVNQPRAMVEGGRAFCLLRTEHEVVAFEDRCPHRGHPLSAGHCEHGVLRCALHGWEFSIPDGEAILPRAPFALELLEVRIENGIVEVGI